MEGGRLKNVDDLKKSHQIAAKSSAPPTTPPVNESNPCNNRYAAQQGKDLLALVSQSPKEDVCANQSEDVDRSTKRKNAESDSDISKLPAWKGQPNQIDTTVWNNAAGNSLIKEQETLSNRIFHKKVDAMQQELPEKTQAELAGIVRAKQGSYMAQIASSATTTPNVTHEIFFFARNGRRDVDCVLTFQNNVVLDMIGKYAKHFSKERDSILEMAKSEAIDSTLTKGSTTVDLVIHRLLSEYKPNLILLDSSAGSPTILQPDRFLQEQGWCYQTLADQVQSLFQWKLDEEGKRGTMSLNSTGALKSSYSVLPSVSKPQTTPNLEPESSRRPERNEIPTSFDIVAGANPPLFQTQIPLVFLAPKVSHPKPPPEAFKEVCVKPMIPQKTPDRLLNTTSFIETTPVMANTTSKIPHGHPVVGKSHQGSLEIPKNRKHKEKKSNKVIKKGGKSVNCDPLVTPSGLTYDWSSLQLNGTASWNHFLQKQRLEDPIAKQSAPQITAMDTYQLMQSLKRSFRTIPPPEESPLHESLCQLSLPSRQQLANDSVDGRRVRLSTDPPLITPPSYCPDDLHQLYPRMATMYQEMVAQDFTHPVNSYFQRSYQYMTADEMRKHMIDAEQDIATLAVKEKRVLHTADKLGLRNNTQRKKPKTEAKWKRQNKNETTVKYWQKDFSALLQSDDPAMKFLMAHDQF